MVTGRAPWVRSEGEAVPGSYVLSRWWRRAGAWFIDGAVLGGASLLLGTVVKEPRLVEYVIVAALTLGYFVPLLGIPLAAFMAVDVVLGEIAHRRGRRTYAKAPQ